MSEPTLPKPMIPVSKLGSALTPTPHFAGAAERQCSQHPVVVPRMFARLLDLQPGDTMLERVITLFVDGEPVLTSTSYLPVELADDDQRWHAVDIGKLALIGHTVTSEFTEERTRMPAPTEVDSLHIPRGVALKVLSLPYQVQVGEQTMPAGVIVLARGDRVLLQWDRDHQELVLRT